MQRSFAFFEYWLIFFYLDEHFGYTTVAVLDDVANVTRYRRRVDDQAFRILFLPRRAQHLCPEAGQIGLTHGVTVSLGLDQHPRAIVRTLSHEIDARIGERIQQRSRVFTTQAMSVPIAYETDIVQHVFRNSPPRKHLSKRAVSEQTTQNGTLILDAFRVTLHDTCQ